MPVPNPPDLLSVYREFGAPNGTLLTAFVRGSTYVIDGVGTQSIPTAPPLDLLDFAGTFVPAALSVDSVTAVSGSVSDVSISGLAVSFTLSHANGSGVDSVSATAVGRVNIRVERATTPALYVAPRASNSVVQGVFRSPFSGVIYPSFDDIEALATAVGPFAQDNTGSSQGTWGLQPPCSPVGASEILRVAQATPATLSAVADGVYGIDFTMSHTLVAKIAGSVGFGQSVTRNLVGANVVFPLSLMFLSGGALVQEVPLTVTVNCGGNLQATAINFA